MLWPTVVVQNAQEKIRASNSRDRGAFVLPTTMQVIPSDPPFELKQKPTIDGLSAKSIFTLRSRMTHSSSVGIVIEGLGDNVSTLFTCHAATNKHTGIRTCVSFLMTGKKRDRSGMFDIECITQRTIMFDVKLRSKLVGMQTANDCISLHSSVIFLDHRMP